jgi:hypothetical protein
MVDLVRPRFRLGRTVATPAALKTIQQAGQSPTEFLDRHVRGDWGDLCDEDKQANEDALQDGSRILSAYHTSTGQKIWIITEATDEQGHRAATTILLADEY